MAWPPSLILISFTLILLQSSSTAAQNSGKFIVGQSLKAIGDGSSWLSPSGDFAFGFHQLPKNSNHFLLSIWYAKIPDTIVWYAYDGNPVTPGSSVIITATEGLVLRDPQGTRIWSTKDEFRVNEAVDYGFMNDTGNFVLKSSDTDDAIWQSFDYPTDTLLPSQILEAGVQVNSRRSETNFTKARFQLLLKSDGNLVLQTVELATGNPYDPYYESKTNENSENAGQRVIYSKSGDLYIEIKNGSRFNLTPSDILVSDKTNYQRVTLDFDGVLSWYNHPKNFAANNSGGWSNVQSLPDNICTTLAGVIDTGACGYNSICSLRIGDRRPRCRCPPNYILKDQNDEYGDCIPNFKQDNCDAYGQGATKDEYDLILLQNIDWPLADYAQLKPCSKDICKSNCLNDCFCAAAIYNEQDQACWKKKLPLSHGREDSGVNRIAWLKVGNGSASIDPVNPVFSPDKVKYKRDPVFAALFGGSVCANFLLLSAIVLGIFLMYRSKHNRLLDEHHRNRTLSEYSSVHCFNYKELEDATDGFKEEIGRGAFGTVYKGIIRAGGSPITVAIKKLDRISKESDKEFKAEVNVIGQTHHRNLVRFIGFCKEEDERLLVYEYMSNGTVADYLSSDPRPSWTERIQVAQGIAKGLLYLHEECSTQIIHCDIKPQNILLDDYFNARISDFGLAKLLVLNQTQTNTAVRGTKGYLAPEWFRNKPVTVKVDVYSFGVLLLEIICCRRSVRMDISAEEAILTDWAFDCYQSNTLEFLVNGDMEALNDTLRLERFVMVALWCIQEDPSLRPTMKRVIQMLEGAAEVASPPCPTSFTVTVQP